MRPNSDSRHPCYKFRQRCQTIKPPAPPVKRRPPNRIGKNELTGRCSQCCISAIEADPDTPPRRAARPRPIQRFVVGSEGWLDLERTEQGFKTAAANRPDTAGAEDLCSVAVAQGSKPALWSTVSQDNIQFGDALTERDGQTLVV
jgi:hypothetical protein